tara:strand:+ start:4 stop:498 length:495 start_codon:yes stop_codon:yes gene_type:complete
LEQSEGSKNANSFIANKKSPLQKVGEFLREARQSRNLSVEDLSSSLRIGQEQLVAIEEGDEKSLPEKVFIRAMVRRISEKLDLDTSFIFEELNEKKNEHQYLPSISKDNTKKVKKINPFKMIILSGALGLITSFLVVNYIEKNQKNFFENQKSKIILLEKKIYF